MRDIIDVAKVVRSIAPLDILAKDKDGIVPFDMHLCYALTNMPPSDLYNWIRQVYYCQLHMFTCSLTHAN